MNTVNVLEIVNGIPRGLQAFPDNFEGNVSAEGLFMLVALENGATQSDIDTHIERGYFESHIGYDLYLVHSAN